MDSHPQSTSTASVSIPASVDPQNPIAVATNEAAAVSEKLSVGNEDTLESEKGAGFGAKPPVDVVERENDAFLLQESDDGVKIGLGEKSEGLDDVEKDDDLETSGLGGEEMVVNPSFVEKGDFTGGYGKTSPSSNSQMGEKSGALGADEKAAVSDLEKLPAVNVTPPQPTESSAEFGEKVDVLEPVKPETVAAEGVNEIDGKATDSEALVDINERTHISKPDEQEAATVNETDMLQSTGTEKPSESFQSNGSTYGQSTLVDSGTEGVTSEVVNSDVVGDEKISNKVADTLQSTGTEKPLDSFQSNRDIDAQSTLVDSGTTESATSEVVNSDVVGDEKISNEVADTLQSSGTEKPPDSFQSNRDIDGQSTLVDSGTTESATSEVVNSDVVGDEKISNEVANTLQSTGTEKPPDSFRSNGGIDGQSTLVDSGMTESSTSEVVNSDVAGGDRISNKVEDVKDDSIIEVVYDDKEVGEGGSPVSEGPAKVAILGSSETAKQILKDLDKGSVSTSSRDFSPQKDSQIISDSDEDAETDEESDGKELFDSAALAALLRAATDGSSDGNTTFSSTDAARIFSVDRPAGLGSATPSLRPPGLTRPTRSSLFSPSDLAVAGNDDENHMDEEEKKLHDKVEQIKVKFLRIVRRLGQSPEDTVASQVLYRLGLAEGIKRGRQTSKSFGLENAKKKALQLEEKGEEDLEFSCTILVLGKSGVGKSGTINSIFGERMVDTNAFQSTTHCVKEIVGVIDGVKVHLIDTPGLTPSAMDQPSNKKILSSIKKFTKKCPPDIVLYVDRLDSQTRDFNDLPLLKSITSTLGSSIWFNAIVALTHAASAPPDGPNGTALSYDVFVAQRSHIVQHSIRQAAGDMRLMNPVALVENHPSCRRNREGQRVLPNGMTWKPQLLLLCYSSKILAEANSLLKLQDPPTSKLFGFRVRSPPLPYLLSSLLQSRPHPKLATDQGDNADSDIDLGDLSDSDQEEEDEYDQLPPFKPLKKSQIAMLTKEQKNAYFDEYDYRVKLLQKKQLKEEIRRMKEMKKRPKSGQTQADAANAEMMDDYDQDAVPAAIPVPLPDMVLPPTFDCDNPAYRYRFLEPTSQLLARPVLDSHGWDHDCGYDGVSLEENLALAGQFPTGVAVQITKDKKEFNIHMDSSIAAKHGENASSLVGFDIQSIGKQFAYILRGETKFNNMKKNKTAGGMSVTFLGENVATGVKIEDQYLIGNRVSLVGSTGAIRSQSDTAYGANLEVKLREKDYPIVQDVSTLGLSLMKWRGDLALGANFQSQVSVGRNSKMALRIGLNNKLTGQISIKTSTSEQLQLALLSVIPIAMSAYNTFLSGELLQ